MTFSPPDIDDGPYDPATMPASSLGSVKAPWYRRPWFLIVVGIVIVAGVSVATDLPRPLTVAQDTANQNGTLTQINTDITPCTYAVKEAFSFYTEDVHGQLTPSDLSQVPRLLIGDQTACSFASNNIYQLTNNLQTTTTRAGKELNSMLPIVTSWTTDNALAAIEDIQTLFAKPGGQQQIHDLTVQQAALTAKRLSALGHVEAAQKILGRKLVPLQLPILAPLPGT